jgi:peptidoglycan/xylan/chitin deacetylase (PgdA/CDA1 family)
MPSPKGDGIRRIARARRAKGQPQGWGAVVGEGGAEFGEHGCRGRPVGAVDLGEERHVHQEHLSGGEEEERGRRPQPGDTATAGVEEAECAGEELGLGRITLPIIGVKVGQEAERDRGAAEVQQGGHR